MDQTLVRRDRGAERVAEVGCWYEKWRISLKEREPPARCSEEPTPAFQIEECGGLE